MRSRELRTAIAEETHPCPMRGGARQVELVDEHPVLTSAELFDQIAPFVSDEGMTIKTLSILAADPVGGNYRHAV